MPRYRPASRLPYFILLLLGSSLISRGQNTVPFQFPPGISDADYAPGVVVVRLRTPPSPSARTAGTALASLSNVRKVCPDARIAPVVANPAPLRPQARTAAHPLANIYKVETEETDLAALIRRLQQLEEVVYAEPYYLLRPLDTYTPDDPGAQTQTGEQDYLATVHAYEAWATERGREDVIIGILDTGVEFGHQDLTDNLYVNTADPINGRDDDGDGYTDNYVGWDMADHDNDPTADTNGHGTAVAGVAAATSDNGTGVAGIGFHSSYMPIKIFRSDNGAFAFGYEAIAYAADRGCRVINLSWGGANAYSRFGEDIINYAVLERDAVVVAAAGNSGQEENFYPASYDRVLSVAVTDAADRVVSQTTYNHWVDIVAPGQRNYSTSRQDGYSYNSGSSFAAPLVAGAAALVRAHYPQWTAEQVMEQLRLSADDIYDVGSNAAYREKLGYGRLNAARALQPLRSPALRAASLTYANHAGTYAFHGDTLDLRMVFKNYLSPTTTGLTVTLTTTSDYVTLLDSVKHLGRVDSLAVVAPSDDSFRVYLHQNLPANEELVFRVGFSAGAYQDYQYVSIVSSSDYVTLDNGRLALSIGSNGDLGYNPTSVDLYGGLQSSQERLASQLGLLLATSAEQVSDNVIQSYRTQLRGQDFIKEDRIRFISSPTGIQTLRSSFTDAAAPRPLGLTVEQTWLSDRPGSGPSYLVGEYRLINTGDAPLTDLQTGLFVDWNLGEPTNNRADWDATHRLGYVYDRQQQTYTGVALLTNQAPLYYAIDRDSQYGNVADTEGELTDAVKYGFMSQGVRKARAGTAGEGNDVAHIVGVTVASLAVHEAVRVGFALVVGPSLEALQRATQTAQELYHRHRRTPPTLLTVPVCTGQSATVRVPGADRVRFYQDPLGTRLLAEGASYRTNAVSADTAVYVAPLRDGYETAISRVAVRITEPVAQFSGEGERNPGWRNDTLFLDESNNYVLSFRDESTHAVAWQWDFDNGFRSTQPYPTTRYTEPGRYTVSLTVTSEPGCTDRIDRPIIVVRRAPRPWIADRTVCSGSRTALQATNTQQITVYQDSALTQRLFVGDRFMSPPTDQTTDFYVVNSATDVPSLPQRVRVRVLRPAVTIDYALDTANLSQKYRLLIKAYGDRSVIDEIAWYVDGTYQGNTPELAYGYSEAHAQGRPIRVQLSYVQDSAGLACAQTLAEDIDLVPAAAPEFTSLRLCQGESATLRPTHGTMFYFYRDKQLDSLLHKGREWHIRAVKMNQTFYVTNMSGRQESEAVAVEVVLNRFANFHMSADTLYLSEGNEAVFEAFTQHDDDAISWEWDLGDGQASHRARRVTQRFDSTGTYRIRLVARTADGCTNTVARTLVVENVTGLRANYEDAAFRLYPNPTTGEVMLENRFWFRKNISLRLYTPTGQELVRQHLYYDAFPLPIHLRRLTTTPLPAGLYLLHVHRHDRVFVRKLYIRDY